MTIGHRAGSAIIAFSLVMLNCATPVLGQNAASPATPSGLSGGGSALAPRLLAQTMRPAPSLPPAARDEGGIRAPALRPSDPLNPALSPSPVPILLETGAGRLLRLPAPAITVMAADP